MNRRVYIETTIPSFYHEVRTEPEMIARKNWNVRHLANANKFEHIRRVNTMMGLFTPTLATTLALLA